MNKQGLITEVSETTGLNREETGRVLETVLKMIGRQLRNGEEVHLVGFGTFSVGTRKSSSGRNPRTGEPISIAPVTQARFRAGKTLKQLVN